MSGLLKNQMRQHMSNKASLDLEYLNSLIAEASRNTERDSSSNRNSSAFKESMPTDAKDGSSPGISSDKSHQ